MRTLPALLLFCVTSTLWSQSLQSKMDSVMLHHINAGELHGGVAYVQKDKKVLLHKAYGFRDVEQKQLLKEDAIFNIASMAKVVTAVGALILYEDGKFLLDDPIEMYLPELGELMVLENIGTDSAKLVPPIRSITIRDLFRHTAGFGYAYQMTEAQNSVDSLYVSKELDMSRTSQDFLERLSEIPLKYQPGSQWEYSYALDVLGFLVEKISRMTLHDFLKQNLFGPLEMTSTGFYLNPEDMGRLSNLYVQTADGLAAVPDFVSNYKEPPTLYAGGGGLGRSIDGALLSSTADFAKFCNMLLDYGQYNGKEILQSQTVELLISNQIGGIVKRSFPVGAYGFGVGVSNWPNNGRTQAISWTGAFKTIFVVNFKVDFVSIFMTQHEPWGHLDIMDKFLQVIEETVP